ncbi:unnamed protein product [Clonostachys rosea]|uniref:Uncharacterized protein n=1 Tax=Bionectria ochroleuca TaxID=29856 RepID=A0ABY6U0I4_BIOOC|nr:unnamed protein product [Clonostachys rosea]
MAAQEQASKGKTPCSLSDTDPNITHPSTASTQTNPAPESPAPANQVQAAEEGGDTDQVQESQSPSRPVSIRRRASGPEHPGKNRNDDARSLRSLPKTVGLRKRVSEPECSGKPINLQPGESSRSGALHKTKHNENWDHDMEIEEICDKADDEMTESQINGGPAEADSDPRNIREPQAAGLQIGSIETITALSSNRTLVAEPQPRTGVIGGDENIYHAHPRDCFFCGHQIGVPNDSGVQETRAFIPYTSRTRTKSDARNLTAGPCDIRAATWRSHRRLRLDHCSKAPQQTVFDGYARTARLLKD